MKLCPSALRALTLVPLTLALPSGLLAETPGPQSVPAHIAAANKEARIEPLRDGFVNAMQVYAYEEGALYQLHASPGHITDIALQPGEQLVGTGPIAAGDTARWIIGDTISGGSGSGSGADARVHILVKPVRAGLTTNLIVNTDRRSYHLELRSAASPYMASLSWTYPQDALMAQVKAHEEAKRRAPIAAGLDAASLNFNWRIKGDKTSWRPLRLFDDGARVFIEFAPQIAQSELPPLFVIGADKKAALVNYRVRGRFMIVDTLFDRAELRLGAGSSARRVQLLRTRSPSETRS